MYLKTNTVDSDSFTILGLWVLGLAVFHINESNCKLISPEGHRPVNVKRAAIGSKGGWKLSTIFLSCKVFDWSIIKLGNILYLLDGSIFAVLFGTTSYCFY